MMAPPAGRAQPALEVLARRDEQPLHVHPLQPAQPELAQAVPLLGLGEERLRPDLALAHGVLVGRRRVVAAHALEGGGVDGAVDGPPAVARGAGRL